MFEQDVRLISFVFISCIKNRTHDLNESDPSECMEK